MRADGGWVRVLWSFQMIWRRGDRGAERGGAYTGVGEKEYRVAGSCEGKRAIRQLKKNVVDERDATQNWDLCEKFVGRREAYAQDGET